MRNRLAATESRPRRSWPPHPCGPARPRSRSSRGARARAPPRSRRARPPRRRGRRCEDSRTVGLVAMELLEEREARHRAHAIHVDRGIEMIALVLHDAGMEAVGVEAQRATVAAVRLDAHAGHAGHETAQPGEA